jgi:hypothetical protein
LVVLLRMLVARRYVNFFAVGSVIRRKLFVATPLGIVARFKELLSSLS